MLCHIVECDENRGQCHLETGSDLTIMGCVLKGNDTVEGLWPVGHDLSYVGSLSFGRCETGVDNVVCEIRHDEMSCATRCCV